MSKSLLILGAFEPEVKELRDYFNTSSSVHIEVCGVGLIAAAVNTANILSSLRAKLRNSELNVLFVGSVGAIDSSVSTLSFVNATEVVLADSSVALGKAFYPELLETRLRPDENLSSKICVDGDISFYCEPVYSTTSITSDVSIAKHLLRQTGARFESLELFAVALACASHDVKWANLSVVTNHVGPDGHEQWRKGHEKAAAIGAQTVKKIAEKFL